MKWQPIETAPSHRKIILYAGDEARLKKRFSIGHVEDGGNVICYISKCAVHTVTHWMPLPEAPTT